MTTAIVTDSVRRAAVAVELARLANVQEEVTATGAQPERVVVLTRPCLRPSSVS